MSDKSELLNQLKIDRDAPPAPRASYGVTLFVSLVSLGLGALGMSLFQEDSPVANTQNPQQNSIQGKAEASIDQKLAQTPTIETAKDLAPKTSEKILNASGYITARRTATVSSQILGLITEVRVEEGMRVEKGQILAKLDDSIAAVNLKFAEAQLKATKTRIGSIKANLAEGERVLARAITLRTDDFSSEASVTRARANVESLKANLASAEADISVSKLEVKRQRERLEYFTITAPFSGIVTVKNAQPGEIVSPSSAGGGFTRTGICTIVDMASLEIEVDVNEAFIGRVFSGQKVEANLDAYPNWNIKAAVIAIIPTADRAKATVRVRIRILDSDSRILPDMGVKVAFLKT